jgi:hypothetical protein
MASDLASRRLITGYRGFVAGRGIVDWIVLIFFIAAGTPVEVADDRSAAGYAFLFKAMTALAVAGLFVVRFRLSTSSTIFAGAVSILASHLLVNLIAPSPSAFMAAGTMLSGMLVALYVVRNSRAHDFLNFLFGGYLIFHMFGFLLSAAIWVTTGEATDLHKMVFPFSSARQAEMLGVMRLTGFHIEPGTYSQAIFIGVLTRAVLRKRLTNTLDVVALLTALATFAAWAAIGVGLYFAAMAFEVFVLNRKVSPGIRLLSIIMVATLGVATVPTLVLPHILQSNYADFISARLLEGKGSGEGKVLQFDAWQAELGFRTLIGQPLGNTYCDYCEGVQDLGLVFNVIYYLGFIVAMPILLVWGVNIVRCCGAPVLIAALPLLAVKFFFYDFLVWVVLGLGMWRPRLIGTPGAPTLSGKYSRHPVLRFCALFMAGVLVTPPLRVRAEQAPGWQDVPAIEMRGGLKAFWNVIGLQDGAHERAAASRGLSSVTVLNTLNDYPGRQRENIIPFAERAPGNPWARPEFFERIVRRNIENHPAKGLYVHDIEIAFERRAERAWADPVARAASGATTFADFSKAYWLEWARWHTLPALWAKQLYPAAEVGIFGPQPFAKEVTGIKTMDEAGFKKYHSFDLVLWQHIDPVVDFIVVETYLPDAGGNAVYYIAMHLELNVERARRFSSKPVYAYQWLRYYRPLPEAIKMVDPYLVEAMALVPFFSGAKGVVLWGYEPQVKPGEELPYKTLPLYVKTLGRVAGLSEMIGRGRLLPDESAQQLWKQRRPLVRRIEVEPGECVVLALNPWQAAAGSTAVDVTCGDYRHQLVVKGMNATLAHIKANRVDLH